MTSPPPAIGRAAIERISALPLQKLLPDMPSRKPPIAFALAHLVPSAGPLHNRHVPSRICDGSSGSRMNGAGEVMVKPSPETSALSTTGCAPNKSGVHSAESEQR